MVRYHHDLDSHNPYLQTALGEMRPELRAAFEHYLVANEVPPGLSHEELGPILLWTAQASQALVGERDMLYLDETEYRVAAALTKFVNVIAARRRALRPDLDADRINAWVEALPPNPSKEEQERLYRKLVLGLDE